jgi:hypothetical protein
MRRGSRCGSARRSTRDSATNSRDSAASCPGSRSRGPSCCRRRTVLRLSRNCFDGRSQLLIYHFMFGPSYEAAPQGRDEGDGWQLWIRRHDEYDRR